MEYFTGALKYPFKGTLIQHDGRTADIEVTGVNGWDCGVTLKAKENGKLCLFVHYSP